MLKSKEIKKISTIFYSQKTESHEVSSLRTFI
jgi:hypothetical protein